MLLRSPRQAHRANPVEPAIHSATARSASEKASARKKSNPPSATPFGPRSGQCRRCAGAHSLPSATTASGSSASVRVCGFSKGSGVIARSSRTSHCW